MARVPFSSLPTGPGTGTNTNNSAAANNGEGQQFVATRSGTITTFAMFLRAGGTQTSLRVAIYPDSAGSPAGQNKLGPELVITTGMTTGQWDYFTGLAAPVVSGGTYWICWLPLGGTVNYSDNAASGGSVRDTVGTPSTWPDPCGSMSSALANIVNAGVMGDDGAGGELDPQVQWTEDFGPGDEYGPDPFHEDYTVVTPPSAPVVVSGSQAPVIVTSPVTPVVRPAIIQAGAVDYKPTPPVVVPQPLPPLKSYVLSLVGDPNSAPVVVAGSSAPLVVTTTPPPLKGQAVIASGSIDYTTPKPLVLVLPPGPARGNVLALKGLDGAIVATPSPLVVTKPTPSLPSFALILSGGVVILPPSTTTTAPLIVTFPVVTKVGPPLVLSGRDGRPPDIVVPPARPQRYYITSVWRGTRRVR